MCEIQGIISESAKLAI